MNPCKSFSICFDSVQRYLLSSKMRFVCFFGLLAFSLPTVAADWQVHLPRDNPTNPSGRLLLLLEPYKGEEKSMLSTHAIYPGDVAVAAQEIIEFVAGTTLSIDTRSLAWPMDLPDLPAGEYLAQVILDRDQLYNLDQGGAGDLYSNVRRVSLPLSDDLVLALQNTIPQYALWEFPNARPQEVARRDAIRPRLQQFEIVSAKLSAFTGQETKIRAWVLLPKNYKHDASRTWPTAYMIGTYGTTHKDNIDLASFLDSYEVTNDPAMIWVFLDFWTPHGPSLFADSVNGGPWGTALVEEFIPILEQRYNMDAEPSGRLLTGHSSGGWSVVWLLTHFPEFFGGAWATAPDSLDFTAFLQTNLYAENANLYFDEQGNPLGVARDSGGIVTTIRDAVELEEILGPQGGVFQNWDWIYSPLDDNGLPKPLFDRDNGEVDPEVAAYWREHYDLAEYIERHWARLREDLNGKLHVFVGTEDNHYLEDSVYLLRDAMAARGARAEFEFLPGKTHNNLFSREGDPAYLFKRIAREMYGTAR